MIFPVVDVFFHFDVTNLIDTKQANNSYFIAHFKSYYLDFTLKVPRINDISRFFNEK